MSTLIFILTLVVILVIESRERRAQLVATPAPDPDATLPGLVAALVEIQGTCPQTASHTARNLLLTGKCSPAAVAALAPFAAVVYESSDEDDETEDEQPN
jgi:hypothetical protein